MKRNQQLRGGYPGADCDQKQRQNALVAVVLGEACDEAGDGEEGESHRQCVKLSSNPNENKQGFDVVVIELVLRVPKAIMDSEERCATFCDAENLVHDLRFPIKFQKHRALTVAAAHVASSQPSGPFIFKRRKSRIRKMRSDQIDAVVQAMTIPADTFSRWNEGMESCLKKRRDA